MRGTTRGGQQRRRRRPSRPHLLPTAALAALVLFAGGLFVTYSSLDPDHDVRVSPASPSEVWMGKGASTSGRDGDEPPRRDGVSALASAGIRTAASMHKSLATLVVRGHREVARMVRAPGKRRANDRLPTDHHDGRSAITTKTPRTDGGGTGESSDVDGSEGTPTVGVGGVDRSVGGPSVPGLSASSWDPAERGTTAGVTDSPVAIAGGDAGGSAGEGRARRARPGTVALLPRPQITYVFGIPRSRHVSLPMPGPVPDPVEPLPHRKDPAYLNGPPVVVNPQGDLERKPGERGKRPERSKEASAGAGGRGGGVEARASAAVASARAGADQGVERRVGAKEATAQRPSTAERAVAKAASFELGADRVLELLDARQDIALGAKALEEGRAAAPGAAKISCGGKPIMAFKEMREAAAVAGIVDVLPPSDDLVSVGGDVGTSRGSDRPSLGRCAVVGNSGALLEAQRGDEIDAHDAVVRFNAAPTRRFEKHVGTKTTVRMQNVDNLGWHEPQDKALIFTGRSENDFRKYVAHRRRKPNINQRIFHPEFWCHVWDWVERRKTKPSTGLAGVVLALRLCDHPVTVYGFSHNSSNFHYFNHLPEKVTTQEVYWYHPLAEEHKLYKDLEGMGRLKMVS